MSIDDCHILDLPRVSDPRGNLTFLESQRHVPFPIERVYYLYDVPGGSERGGHAHWALNQLIISVAGSFDVVLDDGSSKETFHLNSASKGLFISRLIWRELRNFSS